MTSLARKQSLALALLLVCLLGVTLFPAKIHAQELKRIGTACTSSGECRSGNCEAADTGLSYCTCTETTVVVSDDCRDEYGEIAGGWGCTDGKPATYDLNFCVSKNNAAAPHFPVLPLRDPGFLERFTAPVLNSEEISRLQITPETRIRIPGLTFEDLEAVTEEDSGVLYVPFLANYIAALYRWGVAAAAVVAVVMIIRGGLMWVLSGGNESSIGEAKKVIGSSLIGLILAVGSYTVLYSINPELVTFKSLRIQYVSPRSIGTLEFDKEVNLNANVNISRSDLDELFKSYAACFGYDWRILKAFAAAESGLDPNAHRVGSQYFGLFQMSSNYCTEGLRIGGYPEDLKFKCEERMEAETNTAAAAATIDYNLDNIRKACPNVSMEDAMTVLYVGHNNGPAVMNSILAQRACVQPDIRNAVAAFYVSRGGNSKGISTQSGLTKHDYGQQKVVGALKQLGITESTPILSVSGKNPSICPLQTKKRTLAPGTTFPSGNSVAPVGDISCPNGAGKHVLALGDSNTAFAQSYADVLKSSCPNLELQKLGIAGKSALFLFNEIKDRNLRSEGFTDIIVWAGVNDVNNAQQGLQQIYDKAHRDGLRVTAIVITPWKRYGSWTPAYGRKTREIDQWILSGAGGYLRAGDVTVDVFATVADPADPDALNPALARDGIHLNPEGQVIIAKRVSELAF